MKKLLIIVMVALMFIISLSAEAPYGIEYKMTKQQIIDKGYSVKYSGNKFHIIGVPGVNDRTISCNIDKEYGVYYIRIATTPRFCTGEGKPPFAYFMHEVLAVNDIYREYDEWYHYCHPSYTPNLYNPCEGIAAIASGLVKDIPLWHLNGKHNIETIASYTEVLNDFSYTIVINYFIWRQMDTVRNSIQMVAQSLYSHKELLGQNTSKMQELIFQKGINWNDYPPSLKRGRLIIREAYQKEDVTRHRWISTDPNEFTKDNSQLNNIIPDSL